jgi:hypothetical protein
MSGGVAQAKNVGKKRSGLTVGAFVGALILIGTLSDNDHSDTSSTATSTPLTTAYRAPPNPWTGMFRHCDGLKPWNGLG